MKKFTINNIRNNTDYMEKFEELFDSVMPNQINLRSFKPKKSLCPQIWDNNKLNRHVKHQLIKIAKEFIETFKIGESFDNIEDIILVGSITGYNWSKYSDIDLHIVYDFSKLPGNTELIKKYFTAKKNEWNSEHDIKIHNFDIEVYVQDINETNISNGVYSLLRDLWISFPKVQNLQLNKELIKNQSAKLINTIDKLENKVKTTELTTNRLEKYKVIIDTLYKLIVQNRKTGLANNGEQAAENIIFKVLRRSGHLAKLNRLKTLVYDKLSSI